MSYDDAQQVAAAVAEQGHRAVVGGLWDEVGALQLDFLKSQGLAPTDRLLDIGCGSLRGGLRFIAYLEPDHYWGIDSNKVLLDAGYHIELSRAGLSGRLSPEHLACEAEFNFAAFDQVFDAAIAQSLFTHLDGNRIRLCLCRLAEVLKPGGHFFTTYFWVPDDHPFAAPHMLSGGVRTWGFKDPFHYRTIELEQLARDLPWRLAWAGEWGHPRGQHMAIFERLADPAAPPDAR